MTYTHKGVTKNKRFQEIEVLNFIGSIYFKGTEDRGINTGLSMVGEGFWTKGGCLGGLL